MSIRRATEADIPEIASFRRLMFEELDDFEPARLSSMSDAFVTYAQAAIPAEEYLGWIAEDDADAVATAGLVFQNRPPHPRNLGGRSGYILNVFVEPTHRRQGVATALISTAVAYCRDFGLLSVVLHASEAGAPVYERLGFESSDEMRLWL